MENGLFERHSTVAEVHAQIRDDLFAEWPTTFPNAACVVTLVDRLLHRAEVVAIDGDSYRLREAEERQKAKAAARKRSKEGKVS